MRDGDGEWWLAENRVWREGSPPAGWHRGADGRWFPPDEPWGEVHHRPTERMEVLRLDPPAQRPAETPLVTDLYARYLGLPTWTRVATMTVLAVAVLGVLLVTTEGSQVPEEPTIAGPATTSTTPPTTAAGSGADRPAPTPSTTTAGDGGAATTTTPPLAPDALALCGPGQREAIERAKHPWEWYQERYDPDGNGVLCE